MRKLFTILVLALLSVSFVNAGNNALSLKTSLSAHDYPLDNGFILRLGFGISGINYSNKDEVNNINNEEVYDCNIVTSVGIELGSQWYVWRQSSETMGVAINVNWLDFQLGFGSVDYYNSYSSGTDLELLAKLSLIEVGPMYTYVLNDDMAIDTYFNICPTLIASSYLENAGIGLSYAVGVGYRWKVLSAGLEYGFGDIKLSMNGDSPDKKINTGMFKINIGVKL